MSIASEIQRLKTSKADIKAQVNIDVDDINEGTDFIDEETLDDYADLIENMQDAYKQYIPIHTKMIAKGNTSQNGTPTPTSPVEVKTVTGEQVVRVCKKNIFDKSKVIAGYRFGSDGELYATTGCNATDFIPVTPSTNYDVTWTIAWDEVVCLYDINKTFTRRLISGLNFTTEANEYFVRVDVKDGHLDTAQIAKGTSESFEPYKGKDYEVNLGKNLLPINLISQTINGLTIQVANDKAITINGAISATTTLDLTSAFVLPSGTYIFSTSKSGIINNSCYLTAINTNTNAEIFSLNLYNASQKTLTLNADTNVKFRLYSSTDRTFSNLKICPQLEKGTIPTTYAPYFTPIELCKIGNYQDFIRKGTGKNLFDNSVERKNAYVSNTGSTGQVVAYNNSSATYSFVNCCKVEQGKTYTISWKQSQTPSSTNVRIGCIVDNDNIVRQSVSSWFNAISYSTFTANSNGFLILCTDIYATNIQIEERKSSNIL